ncbi:hypothetical protein [Rhodococcus aetherivorans]
MTARNPKGHAEIKPDNDGGRREGVEQLRSRLTQMPRKDAGRITSWLITYAEDFAGGRHRLRVFARRIDSNLLVRNVSASDLLSRVPVIDLGTIDLPPTIKMPFRSENPALFGNIVEGLVRKRFHQRLIPRERLIPGSGGHRRGADAVWELATFYRELAAGLAEELAAHSKPSGDSLSAVRFSQVQRSIGDTE